MTMLLCAVPILWAALTDFRKRIIPDWTWIAILLIGGVSAFMLPYPTLLERIAGFLLPGLCLFLLAMGICFGLYGFAVILFFALVPACIYAKATKQKSVPLAVFLGIGFCIYFGAVFASSLLAGG